MMQRLTPDPFRSIFGSVRTFVPALTLLIIVADLLSAQPVVTLEEIDGHAYWRMDNGRITLLVDPARGGSVTSYRDRLGGDVELIDQGVRVAGLCHDHFQSQSWPGEMWDAHYEVTGHTSDAAECSLAMRYPVTGNWRGKVDENLEGLVLAKTYRLRADSPALECRVQLTAPPAESRLFAYWQQHIFHAGGQYDPLTDKSFRPSVRGVRVKAHREGPNGHTGTEDWLRDFTAGWQAIVDAKRLSGLVSLADYHEMSTSYANGGNVTLEPMFRLTYLPPAQSAEYVIRVVPAVGLDNVVDATEDYIAGYAMESDGQGNGSVTLTVIRSVNAPRQLTLNVTVENALHPEQAVTAGALTFENLCETPQTGKLTFSGAGEDPLVLKVETVAQDATGETASGYFEEYFNGSYAWGENMTIDMVSPVWRGERPPQVIALNKPDPLVYRPPYLKQVWYAEGLLDDYYRLAETMHLVRVRGRRDRAFVKAGGVWLPELSSFPYDYEQLLSYNLILLGGVPIEALGLIGQEMLCDYITAGGGMIVLGGPAAYGPARWRDTDLAELLPVTIPDRVFGLVELTNGRLEPSTGEAPFLGGLDWSAAPRVRYLHDLKVKPWGHVAVHAGERPFLVYGEIGPRKSRVVCVLGAPMGSFGEDETPFWQWADWTYLLRQAAWWAMKEDRLLPDR